MSAPQKKYISWEDIDAHCKLLANKLPQGKFTKIICITRGGLVPAALISRHLDIKFVDTICLSSYDDRTDQQTDLEIIKVVSSPDRDILLLDDLVDTGASFQAAERMLPHAHRACIYGKPKGLPMTHTHAIDVPQDTWIVFPWE